MSKPMPASSLSTAAAARLPETWVAMARRKKAGYSSISSKRERTRASRRVTGSSSSSQSEATVPWNCWYIECRQARRSSSRFAKYT